MVYRLTPDNIEKLEPNEIFVFGSNESGIHGGGAAKTALELFGARFGVGFGLQGQSFAIPTKDWEIRTLPMHKIYFYICRFIKFAKLKLNLNFYVTKIGCGLAGYKPEDIAWMFEDCLELENVYLPKEFIDILIDNGKDY